MDIQLRMFQIRNIRNYHLLGYIRFLKTNILMITAYLVYLKHIYVQKNGIVAEVTIAQNEGTRVVKSTGNGRLDAVSNAFKQYFDISYELSVYEEHSLSRGSSSKAVSYVGISCNGKMYWGVGIDEDIIKSSIYALTVAVNQLVAASGEKKFQDERLTEILNYINTNYLTVTLDELEEQFHLSKPYLSKYIRKNPEKLSVN